jgi:hypothetical protein
MNRDLKGRWDQLRSELQHWNSRRVEDLDWIDSAHDYTRGRVAFQHGERLSPGKRTDGTDAARRR